MLLEIIGIKEEGKINNDGIDTNIDDDASLIRYDINILLESENIESAKGFLEFFGIIVISINKYEQAENIFGKIFLQVKYEDKILRIISKETDINEACMIYTRIGLDIVNINFLEGGIEENEMKNIIEQSKIKAEEEKKMRDIIEKKKIEKKKKVYADEGLLAIRKAIEESIERCDELIPRTLSVVDSSKIKKLKDLRSELSKLKMGTNQIKIVSIGEQFLNLMEDIEIEFLERMKNEVGVSEILDPNSIVSNIDIIKEYSRYFKAIKTKAIGGTVKNEYSDYVTMGQKGIYFRFLQRDAFKKLRSAKDVIYRVYDWIEFILVAVIVEIAIYSIVGKTGADMELKNFVLLSNLGIIGVVLFVIRMIRKKNAVYLVILIPIIVILSIVLIRNLKINLAL
ncbi:hypothetical protein K9M48_04610 [Candidatus Gracilibacteria bacterium]|nr:hypothetical protein [Candidatus Gracilibacteria bacterium]